MVPPRRPAAQEVWAHNLEEEMSNIRDVAEHYQHVAVEVLLPKVVAAPTGPFGDYSEYNYQMLRCNVDLTRALQISLTLSDAKGNRPKGVSTWRFNFDFTPGKDFFVQESLEQLCDLSKHRAQGISPASFGELLMSSGLVLSEEVKWIAYCGLAGLSEGPRSRNGQAGVLAEPPERRFCGMFCFGYLLQLLTSQEMPEAVEGFHELLDLFFPSRCDLAEHLHQLPHMSNRDPTDPLKRPLFCSSQHVLDGFFRLPEAVRRTAFDRVEVEPEQSEAGTASSARRRQQRRRHRDRDERGGDSNGAATNGIDGHVGRSDGVSGVLKVGG